jgi:hypothetical protein
LVDSLLVLLLLGCKYKFLILRYQGGDEAEAVVPDLAKLLAAQGNHRRRVQELRKQGKLEVKVRETEQTESVRLLPGVRCTVAGLSDPLLWCPAAGEPQAVPVESSTREVVVVRCMPSLVCVDAQGVYVRQLGSEGRGDGQLRYPTDLAVDSEHIHVCDSHNDRIQVFGKDDGAFVRQWGSEGQGDGQFVCPLDLAVDSEHVYVSDALNNRIQVFGKRYGGFVRQWGSEGQGDGQFERPAGLAVDSEHIYVSDRNNDRIQVLR